MFGAAILKLIVTPTSTWWLQTARRGQISTINQELESFKVWIIVVYSVSQISWYSSHIMMVPRGISSSQERMHSPHLSVSFALRVQSCDLGSANQMCRPRCRCRSDLWEEASWGQASILLVQMVGEAVWFWNHQEWQSPFQLVLCWGSVGRSYTLQSLFLQCFQRLFERSVFWISHFLP